MSKSLEELITKKRNALKTDRLDMSFGELINMYKEGYLYIAPEYQRVFRWSIYQQTRFIESVLLGIPIPPIFVAEDDEARWEVVDGLQRISTIFSFFGLLTSMPDKNDSTLVEGDIIKKLEGVTISSLTPKIKASIQRAVCRIEIVRWDSEEDIRYELFNRLNTGASPLSDQEIRNCIFRSYKVDLNSTLKEIAKNTAFNEIIGPSKNKKEAMFMEELALRFFAFKYLQGSFKKTVPQYLTEFMKDVSSKKLAFDIASEKEYLENYINFIVKYFGRDVFRPNGQFATHIFDSLAFAVPNTFPEIEGNEEKIKHSIDELLSDEEYNNIGTSTFSNMRIRKRMERALEIFSKR